MDIWLTEPQIAATIGCAGGIVLGLAARLGRFCTLGAIEDYLYANDSRRLFMWATAIGVAVAGSFLLSGAGLVEPAATAYLAPAWNPLAHVVGGTIFGVGMALAGNCGYGALARLGGGDMRAFVIVLVMGISAYVVMSGPLAPLRLVLFPPDLVTTTGPYGLAHVLSGYLGGSPAVFGICAGGTIIAACLGNSTFRSDFSAITTAVAVGLTVPFAWAATSWLENFSFGATAVQSFTFAEPLGETILYAMTASGSSLSFGVGSVLGVACGAFAGSLFKKQFRWEACEDPRELKRQIVGGALMGAGAVLALGCTVGQGLSAISVLSFGAPLTLAGIFLGTALGLKGLISGFHAAE